MDNNADKDSQSFANILDSANLVQHVHGATHRRGHTLDLVISRSNESFIHDLSHHKPPRSTITLSRRSIKNIDHDQLSTEIVHAFDQPQLSSHNVDDLVDYYNAAMKQIFNRLAPTITVKHRPCAKWYSDELRHEKRLKRRLERRYRKSGLTVDKQILDDQTAKYNNLLEATKTDYYRLKINASDRNQLFSLIDKRLKPTALPTNIMQSISSKTCNLDPIPTSELKQHLQQLVPAIAAILKKPDLDTELFQSYRPVANITFIAKVIEKSVAIQTYLIHDYLFENALLPSFQSAYRPHHSTETALVQVTNDILKAPDSQNDIILTELSIAINHITFHVISLLHRQLFFPPLGFLCNGHFGR
ncbi:hypothetical protein AC249_AIPGENE6488 [Exaiptasia diaphana]|nr:hypothetical protein AC249_AIPGENE6488 [Exaiptasia diaphana]